MEEGEKRRNCLLYTSAIRLTGETVETAVHLHAGVFIPVEGTAYHAVPVYGEAV